METIETYVQSLSDFQHFVKKLNGDEKNSYRVNIFSSQKDTLSIILEYNRMNENPEAFFKGNSIEIFVIIEIQKHSDYKEKFGDVFCEPLQQDDSKKIIKSEYQGVKYKFKINATKDINLISYYYKLGLESIYPGIAQNIYGVCEIKIKEKEDYKFFTKFESDYVQSDIFERTEFKLHTYLKDKECIDFLKIYVNNAKKYASTCKKMTNKLYFDISNFKNIRIYSNDFARFVKDHEYEENGKTRWREDDSEDALIFNVDISNVGFDLSFLHNYMLICIKYKKYYQSVILNLTSKANSISEDDKYRIKAYVSANLDDKFYVVFNNELLINDMSSVGKLPPAIYVTKENEYTFLKTPLPKEIWLKFIEKETTSSEVKPINSMSFVGVEEVQAQKYWPMLRMCQKFLFDEFLYSKSKAYTDLKIKLYSSEEFYDQYVCRIPFLALCIFASYDNFFRNELLQKYKEKTGINRFSEKDLIISKQKEQKWKSFEKYESIKKEFNIDIKNLIVDINDDLITIHKTVELEIFEAIMISEGILQILENAVLHAGGGLLSMRIYSRAKGIKNQKLVNENHENYLINTYGMNYLDYLKTNFFLEVYISDLSNMSIPQNFIKKHPEIQEYLEINGWELDLRYFFTKFTKVNKRANCDNQTEKEIDKNNEIKRKFYETSENIVFHYGLDIFSSIITSRAGLFMVEGYNDSYDNVEDLYGSVYENIDALISSDDETITKIFQLSNCGLEQIEERRKKDIETLRKNLQRNKDLNGTSYRILLPLNHSQTDNYNYSNSEFGLKENITKLNEENEIPVVINVNKILHEKELNNPKSESYSINLKEENVKKIAKVIDENYSDIDLRKGKCVCINLYENGVEREVDTHFEEIIKGLVLFALEKIKSGEVTLLPIAIINLTPFHLVEAARQIAMVFCKQYSQDNFNMFQKCPIYLKCIEPGKEIVFEGKNLKEITEIILKTAMANATMYNELPTVVDIIRSITGENGGK